MHAESIADASDRHAALRAAYDAIEAGPDLSEVDSASGLILVLWLSLRRGQRFSRRDAVALANRLTFDEVRLVCRIAWWQDPLDQCAAAIDREIGATWAPSQPEKGDWPKLIAAVALATGWSLDRIGNLTLSQWDVIRRHVAAPEVSQKRRHPIACPEGPPDGWDTERFVAEVMSKRAAFWATDSANPPPDPPDSNPSAGTDARPGHDDDAPPGPVS